MKKPWSPIPNQSNIEEWNFKKNSIIIKELKKYSFKEWWSKLKNKINFIFDWRLKLKRIRIKINIKNKNNVLIEGWN